MSEILPAYSELSAILDAAAEALRSRSGVSWDVKFESVERVIRVKSTDGFESAVTLTPMNKARTYQRDDPVSMMGVKASWSQRSKAWFQLEFDKAVDAFVLGRDCWLKGIAPEDAWRNSPGETYATIMDGAVTVRWLDIIDSMAAPACWSFYLVDDLAFRVSKRLIGEAPSDAVLTAVWRGYQAGIQAGERTGHAEGRRSLQRELGALLSVAA